MKIKANAKVNLSLDVAGKREDGYHELDMIFLEVPLYDTVEIEVMNEPGIRLSCSDPSLENPDNIACKAARSLMEKYGLAGKRGVGIRIEKKIPMQAGLGGGSADAAAVLKGMNELFGLNASPEELRGIGVKLGADVPFFIEGGCARAKGIGEILTPLTGLPEMNILIVKPKESISTAYAYGNLKYGAEAYHPDIEALQDALLEKDVRKAASLLGNSLEAAVTDRYPVIPVLKKELMDLGAYGAVMTGSGSAVFGLFPKGFQAVPAFEHLVPEFCGCFKV